VPRLRYSRSHPDAAFRQRSRLLRGFSPPGLHTQRFASPLLTPIRLYRLKHSPASPRLRRSTSAQSIARLTQASTTNPGCHSQPPETPKSQCPTAH
jgi:hypothetical protein